MLKLLKQTRLVPFKLPRIFLPGSLLGTNQNTVLLSTQSEDEALLNPPGLSLHGVFRVLSSLTGCSAGGWARKAERTQHGPPASQEKELGAAGRISLRHSQPARPPQHRRAPRGRDRPGRAGQGGTAGTAARQGRGLTGGTARGHTRGARPGAGTGGTAGASQGYGPGPHRGQAGSQHRGRARGLTGGTAEPRRQTRPVPGRPPAEALPRAALTSPRRAPPPADPAATPAQQRG